MLKIGSSWTEHAQQPWADRSNFSLVCAAGVRRGRWIRRSLRLLCTEVSFIIPLPPSTASCGPTRATSSPQINLLELCCFRSTVEFVSLGKFGGSGEAER